ncbi:MAG: phosphoserine phosphatase SerB [Actinobacteria bacterium]|nr:phosphoserine phosphatase SerB [Actinomycetota bacterium]
MTSFLVVFDVDSTLINEEAIELLAEHSGNREKVAEITERSMRGEIDFSTSLIERVATLKGLPESVLEQTAKSLTPTKGASELIQEIHTRGGKAAAVSGGFIQLLTGLKRELNLDYAQANTLGVENGRLTGEVVGELVNREVKAKYLKLWAKENDIPLERTFAIGDGANDLGMMAIAGLSVAFCAKPIVRESADVVIDERDLTKVIALLP